MKTPLFNAIQLLISDGRLTGAENLTLDGERFFPVGDATIDPVMNRTFENGFSLVVSEWGGRMVEGVEDLRDKLRSRGQDAAANALPQWFVRMADRGKMEPKQAYTATENHVYVYMIRAMAGMTLRSIAQMTEYSPRLFVKGTKEPEWRYISMLEADRAPGGANPGAMIPNHRICVDGASASDDWTAIQITAWAEAWAEAFLKTGEAPNNTL